MNYLWTLIMQIITNRFVVAMGASSGVIYAIGQYSKINAFSWVSACMALGAGFYTILRSREEYLARKQERIYDALKSEKDLLERPKKTK